jgi:hypothetical protein
MVIMFDEQHTVGLTTIDIEEGSLWLLSLSHHPAVYSIFVLVCEACTVPLTSLVRCSSGSHHGWDSHLLHRYSNGKVWATTQNQSSSVLNT